MNPAGDPVGRDRLLPELVQRIAAFIAERRSGTVALNFADGRVQSVEWKAHERMSG